MVAEQNVDMLMCFEEEASDLSENYLVSMREVRCAAEPWFSGRDVSAEMLRSIQREINFDAITGRLKDCNLEMLLRFGVPDDLVLALGQIVNDGLDEHKVVLTCLLVFARLPDGPRFSRDSIRAIRKAASGADIDDHLLAVVLKVIAVVTGLRASVQELLEDLKPLVRG